jgi:hypothetical protein
MRRNYPGVSGETLHFARNTAMSGVISDKHCRGIAQFLRFVRYSGAYCRHARTIGAPGYKCQRAPRGLLARGKLSVYFL